MSIALSNASRLKPEIRLAQAVSQFEADLSSEQKATFRNYRSQSQESPPDPSDVMRLTAEVDFRASKVARGRCFGPRLTNFLQAVQQFAALGDIIISGSQDITACSVWSLLIANFSSYLEKLSTLLMIAGHSAPRYQTMALLYPQSKNLRSYLSEYFIVVVNLCCRLSKFTKKSTLGQFASSLSDLDIKTYQSDLDHWANAIKEEVSLQMAKTIEEEAQDNSRFRALSSMFSTSALNQQKLKANFRILNSCSMYDYTTTWKQTRKIGNTTLFNQIDEYKDWKGQETSCTLIYTGGLGSGKSVLLANLIDDLYLDNRNKKTTVAYFFCRYDISESLKAETIIGSLARQLLEPIADLASLAVFVEKTTVLALDFDSIFSILQSALPPKTRAYFVLDGVNECDSAEREILIRQLRKLQETFSLVLCISARLDPDDVLKLSPERFIAARVASIPSDNPDIDAFISAELESHIESRRLVIGNPLLILEIQDALLKGSQGMFLWVALQIISLCDMKTDDAIRQALADLPKDLSEVYSRILRKSEGSGKTYQRRTLELVTIAHRPLTAEELRDALGVVPGNAVWSWSTHINDVNLILTCCGSLLTIDEEERTIRLVHHSVKQFIFDGFKDSTNTAITIDSANRTMANIIVTYLNYSVFETQLSSTVVPQIMTASAPSRIIRSTPDLSSTVQKLALLYLKSREQPNFNIGKTLAETKKLFRSRQFEEFCFYSYAKPHWLRHIFSISEQELHIYGLLRRLFNGNVIDVNATDKEGWTPLSLGARDGHEAVVKLLLDSDIVDVDSKNEEGRTPLSWAAENGQEGVLKLLLNSDIIDVNSKDRFGKSPLLFAAENGHVVVAKLLLVKGAELEAQDVSELTPLSWAAKNGHKAVVELLLHEGAKLESEDCCSYTPLIWAANNGHGAVVKLLLEKGADLEFKCNGGGTPLSFAAEEGREAVVELLLNKGADLESKDKGGRTPLSLAAWQGKEAVVELLLNKGANLESVSNSNSTPLVSAAVMGRKAVVELLLDRGANLEAKDNGGQTPLSNAANLGREAVVELLLNRGASLESRSNSGRTPLSFAAGEGEVAVVKLLLNKGAQLESKDADDRTPLLWAMRNGREVIVKATRKGHDAVVKLLLEEGDKGPKWNINGYNVERPEGVLLSPE
ncbi:hypothetical protein V493_06729 [Pseudogymnoascus sp. VKM F-4281 (FW-2241)]|nr:hypothetical protein V493_06729 [Pseudogymnoascus sp. VKM F-4281 (FW-2241)]